MLILNVLISALVSYFISSSYSNIRFVSDPRKENEDYGYLEIEGKKYRQLYTTTQDYIGNGLHIHRTDVRSSE